MKAIPFSLNNFACGPSSVYRELPPSITKSPSPSSSASDTMVSLVTGPDGTITQTTRGAGSASASAAKLGTSVTSGRGS